MSAHDPESHRRTDRNRSEQRLDRPGPEMGHVSTRVLLESGTPPVCEACGDAIEMKARHKCLTVRDECGTVREFTFCDETCLARDDGQET